VESTLKRIQEKIQQLARRSQSMQQENNRLRKTAAESEEKLKRAQEQIQELRTQIDVLKLNAGELATADKKEIEKKINAYLKEIDRCIALLGE
jgi:chromosome segregation ATPase